MPNNLNPANPTDVMPAQLAKAFTLDMQLEMNMNNYPDGSSDRLALALNARAYFRLTQGLSAADWQTMFTFYQNHIIHAFYFYNLRETVPPFSWDATGQDTVGRYTVVFDGPWGDVYLAPRTQVQLGLREVV
jgi:hypothetical protein